MKNPELTARWTPDLLQRVNGEIVKAGKQRLPFPASPFGATEGGRADFRGFVLREKIVRLSIEHHDFSFLQCEWAGALVDCSLLRCVLDHARFDGRVIGSRFEACSFASGSLSGCALGGQFIGCDFSRANLSKSKGNDLRFVDCLFDSANLRQALWLRSRFERCSFANARLHNGSFAGSTFTGVDAAAVNWDNTIMDHVTFA